MNRFGALTAGLPWEQSWIRRNSVVLCLSVLLLTSVNSEAQSATAANANHWVALLEARYRASKTTQATFLERYTESGRLLRVEAGQVYFRRPGKMRWEYASPENNLFLVDGKTAWFYVPGDHTVTRVPAKRSADWRTPLALLAGDMKVSRVCSRVEIATHEKPNNPGDVLLECQLRGASKATNTNSAVASSPDSQAAPNDATNDTPKDTTVFLEVAPDTGDLVRVLVRDKGGVNLEFRFENWHFDPVIADSQFEFHPPAGVAILNGELPLQNETVK
jgi:outer membrane lipoprotein carrier protein